MEAQTSAEMQAAIDSIVERVNTEVTKQADQRDTDLIGRLNKELTDDLIPAAMKQYAAENPSFSLPGAGEEKGADFSYAAAIWGIRSGDWSNAGYELECFKEMSKLYGDAWSNAMSTKASIGNTGYVSSVDGLAGPTLVPEEHMNEIIDLFYASSVAFQLGARGMPGAFGTISIPVLLAGASATWSYENVAITPSNPQYGEHTMRPRRLGAAVPLSNMLITNSRPMAESIVRDNLFEQFRIALDSAIIKGSGSGANPTGLLNATAGFSGELDSGAVDLTNGNASGNPWTFAAAMEFLTDLMNVNAMRGSLGWAMNPTDWSNAIQMPSGTSGVDVTRIVTQDGATSRLLGYPLATTTTLAHTGLSGGEETVIFGDWSQIRVPFWKTLELRASDVAEDTFLKDQTLVRGIMYADVSVDHLESFSIGTTWGA